MGNWSIELGERAIPHLGFLKPVLGKEISHSFVRIKNDEGQPVLELHGLWTNGAGAAYNSAAKLVTNHPHHTSLIHVLALTSPRMMQVFTAHLPVTSRIEIEGSEDMILRDAECMVRTAKIINRSGMDYFLDLSGTSQTCHSVSAALFRCLGIDVTSQQIGFITPGRWTVLENKAPELQGVTVDKTSSLPEIKAKMFDELQGLSPDIQAAARWLNPVRETSSTPINHAFVPA